MALAAVVLVLPWLGLNSYWQRQTILVALLALVVSGLNLSFGYAGELALGQTAAYAAGAYLTGYLGVQHGIDNVLATLGLSALAAAVIGFALVVPGLRLGGWSLAMLSFFIVLLIPNVANILEGYTGGVIGLPGIPFPQLFGHTIAGNEFYLLVIGVTVLWFAVFRNLITSHHGDALLVLRQSPILASSLGISVYRLKIVAYVLGAVPAGLAGCLFAYLDLFIGLESFTFTFAISTLAASVIGGSRSVYGAILGAALLQLGPLRTTWFQDSALISYGAVLILFGVLFSGGAIHVVRGLPPTRWLAARLLPSGSAGPDADHEPTIGKIEPIDGETLTVEGVSKRFGGLVALQNVSLVARPGEVTALIGPNGSGKTTLLNLISGFFGPSEGRIEVGGDDLTGRPAFRVARAGVARTFQTPLVPSEMTAANVVATARYMKPYSGLLSAILRLPRYLRKRRSDASTAQDLLSFLGIGHLADHEASSLSLGTRRLLELARACAASPRLVLLDEPGSGLDESDLERLAGAIRAIRDGGGTVILVEHNFPLVLALADTIHVLSRGEVIASGTPAEIESHPRVLEEYLGTAAHGETIHDLEQEMEEPEGRPEQ